MKTALLAGALLALAIPAANAETQGVAPAAAERVAQDKASDLIKRPRIVAEDPTYLPRPRIAANGPSLDGVTDQVGLIKRPPRVEDAGMIKRPPRIESGDVGFIKRPRISANGPSLDGVADQLGLIKRPPRVADDAGLIKRPPR
jgi:hypothetical protein